jgi:AAA15 family ATPase/GTPase
MYISQIRAENFRNFKTLEIRLEKLNIIVGANASGKSNFLPFCAIL